MTPILFILQRINWSELNYTYDEYGKTVYSFPVHIRLLLATTLIFLLVILILLGIILSSRIYKTGRAIKKNNIKLKYQSVLSKLLFEERISIENISGHFDKVDKEKRFNRNVLLEEIIHLHSTFSGESGERLEDIYVGLNLHTDSIKKLNDKSWHTAAKGMRELALMNIKQAIPQLNRFIDNPNPVLRMESRIAIMNLSTEDPLSFLSGKNIQMSGWDVAKIYVLLSKLPEKMIPDFSRWLDSNNKDVLLFSIQMTGSFRQQSSVPKLIQLLKSENENIRLAALKSIRSLNASQAEKQIIEMYPKENEYIKLEVLKTLESIGSLHAISFLEKVLQPPLKDYHLLIQAARVLLSLGNKGQEIIDKIFLNSGEEMQLIINHAKDKRL